MLLFAKLVGGGWLLPSFLSFPSFVCLVVFLTHIHSITYPLKFGLVGNIFVFFFFSAHIHTLRCIIRRKGGMDHHDTQKETQISLDGSSFWVGWGSAEAEFF